MSPHGPTIYLNNCRGYDYFDRYGWEDAFYDLNIEGRQANQAANLQVGQECLVATVELSRLPLLKRPVRFSRHSFRREKRRFGPRHEMLRVLRGDHIGSDVVLPQGGAAADPRFEMFFNKKSHFRQKAVI